MISRVPLRHFEGDVVFLGWATFAVVFPHLGENYKVLILNEIELPDATSDPRLPTERITIVNSGNALYPYKLINTDGKSVAEAKLISR